MIFLAVLATAFALVQRHKANHYTRWKKAFEDEFLYHPEIQVDQQRLFQMCLDGLTPTQACNVFESELTIETKTHAFESGNVIRKHKSNPVKKESIRVKQFPLTISKHDSYDMLRYDPVLMNAARLKELQLKEECIEVWERRQNMLITEKGYYFCFFESELKSERV